MFSTAFVSRKNNLIYEANPVTTLRRHLVNRDAPESHITPPRFHAPLLVRVCRNQVIDHSFRFGDIENSKPPLLP